jgi:site-specific DNA-methyltransferase (adenine-specific)
VPDRLDDPVTAALAIEPVGPPPAEPPRWQAGFQVLAFASLALLPAAPGVYVVSRGEEVLHVGGARNLRARWQWQRRASQVGVLEPGLVLHWREDEDYRAAEQHLMDALQPASNSSGVPPRDADLALLLQEPPMTEEELAAAEAVITQHLTQFLEVGRLLVRIQSSRVYRYLGYRTFERYLAERIGLARRTGYLYLSAAQVADTLSDDSAAAPDCAHDTHEVDSLPVNLGVWKLASLAPLPERDRAELALAAAREHLSVTQLRGLVAEKLRARRQAAPPPSLVDEADERTDFEAVIQVLDAGALPWSDGSCDLILTSPPYCLDVPYAEGGDVPDYPTYRQLMAVWAAELYRVSHPEHGRLCLNVPVDRTRGSHEAIYAHWVAALEGAGWRYRTTIFWLDNQAGPGAARGSVDSPGAPSVHAPLEAVIVAYRGQWPRHETRPHDLGHDDWLQLCGPRGLWDFPGVADAGHPAPFPEELALRCIRLYTYRGDVVADPFAGRGTTPAMAARLGRRVLAGDRAPAYVALARAWTAKERAAASGPALSLVSAAGPASAGDQRSAHAAAGTVEVACLLCGRTIPAAGQRCAVCGGPAIPADAEPARRPEPRLDWAGYRPRRGGPPKDLVQQRRAEEDYHAG